MRTTTGGGAGNRGTSGAPARRTPERRREAPRRPASRPADRAASGGRRPPPRPRAPRVPFVLLILGLLGGSLVSLLVLQAVLAEDAHTIAELQQHNRDLSRQQEALRQEVLHADSPEAIAERAEELGMEPGEEPLFLDLESNRVLGEAEVPEEAR